MSATEGSGSDAIAEASCFHLILLVAAFAVWGLALPHAKDRRSVRRHRTTCLVLGWVVLMEQPMGVWANVQMEQLTERPGAIAGVLSQGGGRSSPPTAPSPLAGWCCGGRLGDLPAPLSSGLSGLRDLAPCSTNTANHLETSMALGSHFRCTSPLASVPATGNRGQMSNNTSNKPIEIEAHMD